MESERPPPLRFRNKEHPEEPVPNRITGRRSEKQLVQKKRGESIRSTPRPVSPSRRPALRARQL